MRCEHCDVTMVFHRHQDGRVGGAGGYVRCHHCLAEQKLPEVCPISAHKLSLFGAGTQRLEEELARKYPALVLGETMLRLDSDTMHSARHYFEALERFGRGEVRLLLGTQMIAKGLDYPNVRLIGVVNADTAINLPDFRSSERTFQLIAQVAGRAGRSAASARSRVIVQTLNPLDPAIVAASRHDYRGFADRELKLRAAAGLPPIGRMVRIVFRDRDYTKAETAARHVYDAARTLNEKRVRVRPPAPCAISRIGDHHRIALDMLATAAGPLQLVLTELRNMGLVKSDAHTAVDVDPVALL
jgi:primosomal protein N' (replication factor Y)